MKIKKEILQAFMTKYDISVATLADELNVEVSEIEKLLSGQSVDEITARKFICYFGVDEARELVDWQAMGKPKPRN